MTLELLALLLFIAIILFAFLVFSLVNVIVYWITREEIEYKEFFGTEPTSMRLIGGMTTKEKSLYLHGMTHALCEIPAYFRQLTYALRRRILNIVNIFPCALCGPFDNLHFHPALTFPDSLWVHN